MCDRLLQLRVGPQAVGFFQVTKRVGEAAGNAGESQAEVALHCGIVGVNAQCGFKFGGGFGQTSGISQSGAQTDVGFRRIRRQAHGDLQLRDGEKFILIRESTRGRRAPRVSAAHWWEDHPAITVCHPTAVIM